MTVQNDDLPDLALEASSKNVGMWWCGGEEKGGVLVTVYVNSVLTIPIHSGKVQCNSDRYKQIINSRMEFIHSVKK